MGTATGRPRGRPVGSTGVQTLKRAGQLKDTAAAIEKVLKKFFPGDAHAFLMSIYKDEEANLEARLKAATAAIRYEKPALATTTIAGDPDRPLAITRVESVIIDPKGKA